MLKHCGYVAIVGAPNAGKSTLLNKLVGSSLAIVTPKPQTTRTRMHGIVCEGNAQIIFVDTPGIFDAKPKFEKAMVDAAWTGMDEADILMLVIDANRRLDDDTRKIAESLKARGKRAIVVLNKVDKISEKIRLPELAKELYDIFDFEQSFMISATRGDGVADILKHLAGAMPKGEWLYPEDEPTDSSERELAAEITREQCFLRLHAELPYSLMVETEKWEVKENGIRISQIIMVERESQKKIILGAGGAMLKAIGSAARRKIGEVLDVKVHLFLFVKVSGNWKDDPAVYKTAGLEYKK